VKEQRIGHITAEKMSNNHNGGYYLGAIFPEIQCEKVKKINSYLVKMGPNGVVEYKFGKKTHFLF
jgi:hypothetical protein